MGGSDQLLSPFQFHSPVGAFTSAKDPDEASQPVSLGLHAMPCKADPAGPARGGAGTASGFGFRPSGGVAAKCACDSGYGWQKQGDHLCGCSPNSQEDESPPRARRESRYLAAIAPANGGPELASSSRHTQCPANCCCCIEKLCVASGPGSDTKGGGHKQEAWQSLLGDRHKIVAGVWHYELHWFTEGAKGGANPPCTMEMFEAYFPAPGDGRPARRDSRGWMRPADLVPPGEYRAFQWRAWNAAHEANDAFIADTRIWLKKQICPSRGVWSVTDALSRPIDIARSGRLLQFVVARSGCPDCIDCCALLMLDFSRKQMSVKGPICGPCDLPPLLGGGSPGPAAPTDQGPRDGRWEDAWSNSIPWAVISDTDLGREAAKCS